MPEPMNVPENNEGPHEVKPDPWIPPGSGGYQAASIATGATGAALLIGDKPSTDTADQVIAMLPDPTHVFASAANVLGFQFNASSAWTWGLILVVVSVVLNIISFSLRYRHAQQVEREWAALQAKNAQVQASATATRKGFIPGEG
jgi:hypothetical protein